MAEDQTVSPEAFERIKRERDELKSKVDELSAVVTDVGYRDKTRSWLKSQGVADPDAFAEFFLPHVRTVELDQLEATLASDRFKPFVSMATTTNTPPPAEGETPPPPPPVNTPATSGFSGPNPGAPAAGPTGQQRISGRDLSALAMKDPDAAQAAINAGLVDWSPQAEGAAK